jgi:hypothetical protein
VSVRKWLFSAISASDSDFNPRNTQSIPPVKIFVFLDLAKNISFSDGHYLTATKSIKRVGRRRMSVSVCVGLWQFNALKEPKDLNALKEVNVVINGPTASERIRK